MAQLANDNYGRTVVISTANGEDTYTVTDTESSSSFTVLFSTGTPTATAYQTINAMPCTIAPQTNTQIYTAIVIAAQNFGQQLTTQFAVQNILAGITQSGKTQELIDYTNNLSQCLFTGSLYAAIAAINVMIADTSSTKTNLSPFVTNNVLYSYLNQIQSYLGIALTSNPGP